MAQFVEKQGVYTDPQDAQQEDVLHPQMRGLVFSCVFEANARVPKGLVSGWIPPDRPSYYEWP